MRLIDSRSGAVVIEGTEARGFAARVRGLLGRDPLEEGRGLWLAAKQVHTVGMRFAIDAVYLDAAGSVLRVKTLAPGRLGPLVPKARWVLEIGAGEASRLGIAPGDRFRIEQ